MVADFTRTDSLKMALASGLDGDLEPCVRDGCASRTASKYRNTTTATHHVAALDAALPCSATNMVAAAGSSGRRGTYSRKVRQRAQHQPRASLANCVATGLSDRKQ
jgi:hypothetical protein